MNTDDLELIPAALPTYNDAGMCESCYEFRCDCLTLARQHNRIAELRACLAASQAEVERLREERDSWRKALRDFGRHRPSCGLNRRFDAAGNVIGFGTECDCGLFAALAEPRKGE